MKKNIHQRVALLVESLGISQRKFAEEIGISSSRLSNVIKERNKPDSDMLALIASKYTDINPGWLLTGEGEMWRQDVSNSSKAAAKNVHPIVHPIVHPLVKNEINEPEVAYGKTRVLAIAVDKDNNEVIKLVPVMAHAGYLSGFQDPEYVADLPTVSITGILPGGSYRAFEVKGDSMEPTLQPGDRLLCRYVEAFTAARSHEVYVVIAAEEIRVKRVIKKDTGLLLCSDNNLYQDYTDLINYDDIRELWKVEGLIRVTIRAV